MTTLGLPAIDGEFMFLHFEGRAWRDVKDWKAQIRKWKLAGWLPSQKQDARKPANEDERPLPTVRL